MPYNSETETFYQAPATVVDSTPDGDTVQEGFDDRLTPAMAGLYADLNLLKADGMISVGIPATTTARGIGRVATSADLVDGATITNGPAFLAAGQDVALAAANFWVGARYAECSTSAATAAKAADLANFQLVKGSRVFVTFANANTVAGALTLNVNGTGAKSIYNEQGAVSATNPATFPAGVSIEFIYDGTNWTYRKYQDEFAKVSGGAPMYACRAWVNFNGITAVINGSGNVSSVVHNGAGDYTVNFTKAMPDTNYSLTGNCEVEYSVGPYNSSLSSYTTTSARIQTGRYSTGKIDNSVISISIFR